MNTAPLTEESTNCLPECTKTILLAIEEVKSADGFKPIIRWINIQRAAMTKEEVAVVRNALYVQVAKIKGTLEAELDVVLGQFTAIAYR